MGSPKALLPFRGGTFLSVLAGTLAPFCSPRVAVFGFQGEALSRTAPPGVRAVLNERFEAGMLTSLQAGLATLDLAAHDRILFTLVDHPAIRPETIAALLDSGAPIAIPKFHGKRGHPVVVNAGIAREFLAEPPEAKVRYTIDRHASEIMYLDVNDRAINDDIDDPALYAALLEREAVRL